jgi:hypothetical protein
VARLRWYHGTRYRFSPGDLLEGGLISINQGFGGPPAPHVHYTSDRSVAAEFARCAYGPDGDPSPRPRIYEIQPDATHETDPGEESWAQSFRALRCRVVREARFPNSSG